jgi:ribosomal-protein-alanine N-acetyltransferase
VRDLCRLAASRHGITKLRAAAAEDNSASRRVLVNAGFVPVGPADPADVGGKRGTWFEGDLTAEPGHDV